MITYQAPALQDTTAALDTVQAPDPAPVDTVAAVATDEVVQILGVDPNIILQNLLKSTVILVLAWVAIRVLKTFTRRMLAGFEAPPGSTVTDTEQRAQTLVQLLNSVGTIVIAIAAVLSVLNLFVNIGPLIAGIGVLGLAVSFGAQSLVKDIISGFFILFENQYDVGDVVDINGTTGVVEAMTLRIVTLRDLDGIVHTIPNGSITKVGNKTAGWSRVVLDVGVAYHEDVDRVLEVLRSTMATFWSDEDWKRKLIQQPEVLGVQELADSAVLVRLVLQTKPGKQWEVKREVRRRVKKRFDTEGIEIPFPQRTVHMRGKSDTT